VRAGHSVSRAGDAARKTARRLYEKQSPGELTIETISRRAGNARVIFAVALPGHTQQRGGSESNAHASRASKHYFLPATPENVQWGWYDPGGEAEAGHQLW